MTYVQLILAYLTGLTTTVFVPAYFVPRHYNDPSWDYSLWATANVIQWIFWPVALPILVALHTGSLFSNRAGPAALAEVEKEIQAQVPTGGGGGKEPQPFTGPSRDY